LLKESFLFGYNGGHNNAITIRKDSVMQDNKISWDEQVQEQRLSGSIENFFREYHVGTLLHQCGIRKLRGISPMIVLHCLFGLSFLGDNIFRHMVVKAQQPFGKDVLYDFLRSERFNWRRLLLLLAARAISFIDGLTGRDREKVLIIDDSVIERPRSKKVELLSRVYDHASGRFVRGFRMLTVGWSDGASFLPLDFAMLSSRKEENRFQGMTKEMSKKCCGYKRRQESMVKATDLIDPMVERILSHGIKAGHILMDSWFGTPAVISRLHKYLPVICMVKNTPKIHYGFAGMRLPLRAIYGLVCKRPGKAKFLASSIVTLNDGLSAKLVFVRSRKSNDWLALLSTDVDLPDEKIVEVYGKRWDIEVFFKVTKQHLNLENGIQSRDFDSIIAHTTIVMMRHVFLTLLKRRHDDPRSLGLLFHRCCEEVKDLSFIEALRRVQSMLTDTLEEIGWWGKELCNLAVDIVLKAIVCLLHPTTPLWQTIQQVR
jgi:hypothetical protein